MFITPPYAQTAGGPGGGIMELLFPLILVGGIMWFLVIRPQRQQQKARPLRLILFWPSTQITPHSNSP